MSFDSYIKPQLLTKTTKERMGCISFDSYIKPQHYGRFAHRLCVVYLLIPTSNHNGKLSFNCKAELYIF